MNNFIYNNNTCKLIFGKDTVNQVGNECSLFGKKVLMVYGGKSIKQSGLYDKVLLYLKSSGLSVYEIDNIQPNPRISKVREGVLLCKREGIDFILAVGGGSVIDSAKGMAAGAKYSGDVWDFYARKAEILDALPVGDILTIAATGSESNKNSVITNEITKEKHGAGSPLLIPKFAILDPSLTATVPRDQTVNGIVDILAHVFEQYFSPTPSTYLLDRMAEAVMKTVIEIGPKLLDDLSNYDYRAEILWSGTCALNGSLSCGKKGDFASHMIEHEISALYDIPHGAGLSIVFPNWMKYVYKTNISKFVSFAVNVWNINPENKTDEQIAIEGIEALSSFYKKIGSPTTLSQFNIDQTNIKLMSENCTKFGPVGALKELSAEDVDAILRLCL
jgi:alcohol dehydrogenase YqhD (iron-dependent ADH family)